MNEVAEGTQAGPDLSAFGRDDRINAAVAVTQGWQVRVTDEDDAPMFEPGMLVGLPPDWRTRWDRALDGIFGEANPDDGPEDVDWTWIPQVVGDPAEWGEMMQRELQGWERTSDGEGHRAFFISLPNPGYVPCRLSGPVAATLGEAVSLAVLVKHGHDVTPYLAPA